MKSIKNFKHLFPALLVLAILVTSCHSIEVLSSWSLESPPEGVLKKVMVLGIMPNRGERENIELSMVNELGKAGVIAATATSLFGPKGFKGLSEEQIGKKLIGSDFTSVMIVSLIDKEKEKDYIPGSSYTSPRIVGYSRYYRRYIVSYDRMYTPGYYRTNTNYVLEADLYTTSDEDALVYSAQTKSYDPHDSKMLADTFAKSIVNELRVKGLLK